MSRINRAILGKVCRTQARSRRKLALYDSPNTLRLFFTYNAYSFYHSLLPIPRHSCPWLSFRIFFLLKSPSIHSRAFNTNLPSSTNNFFSEISFFILHFIFLLILDVKFLAIYFRQASIFLVDDFQLI